MLIRSKVLPSRSPRCASRGARHVSYLASESDFGRVLAEDDAEGRVVLGEDEPGDQTGVEQPEVVFGQAKSGCLGAWQVADVLTSGHVAQAAGQEKSLPLGRRLVDEPDPLEPLSPGRLRPDILAPCVVRLSRDVHAAFPLFPLRAVAVGGVSVPGFQPERGVPELAEQRCDLGERHHLGMGGAWSEADQEVAWHQYERLAVLHIAELGKLHGVGHAVALDEDVGGAFDLVKSGAVSVVAGGTEKPEDRHSVLRLRWVGIQDAADGARPRTDCAELQISSGQSMGARSRSDSSKRWC